MLRWVPPRRSATLFRAVTEIIEQRHAFRFAPDAHLSRILERLVIPVDGFLAIEHHREMVALKIYPEAVPLVRRHLHIRPLLFRTAAVYCVVDGDVVLERVGTGDVVVIRVLRAPCEAPSLVILARQGLELYFHKTILDVAVVPEADGIGGHTRLFEDVRFTRSRAVLYHHPPRGARAGLCRRPAIGGLAGLILIKIDCDGLSDEHGDIQGHEHGDERPSDIVHTNLLLHSRTVPTPC